MTLYRALALSAALALPSLAAGPLDLTGGLRASIFDDVYKLGVGGSVGLIQNYRPQIDLGAHLNYSHFSAKPDHVDDVSEVGGYVSAYYLPTLADQPFEIRLGPHLGAASFGGDWNLDLGGEFMAVFQIADKLKFHGAFIPSFFIGEDSQSMFRIGLGIEYRIGDGIAPAATGYEQASEPDPAP